MRRKGRRCRWGTTVRSTTACRSSAPPHQNIERDAVPEIVRHAPFTREAPADAAFNAVQGTVKELSYFGSFTVYQIALSSGAMLKVSQANTERHSEAALTWGDQAWAQWSPSAPVVLTA